MKRLFLFIRALDASEKKYFRRYGLRDTSKEDNQTRDLFELLESQSSYDEEKIQNRLRRIGLDKKAEHTARYLYSLLTEGMVWYHRHRFSELSRAFDFTEMQLLEEKGMQEESAKLGERLRSDVLAKGSFTEKWQVLSYSIHEATNQFLGHKKTDDTEVAAYLVERELLLEKMQRYHAYDSLLFRQLNLIRKAMQARNKEDFERLTDIFSDPLINDISLADSPEARFTFHTIRLQHYSTLQLFKEALAEATSLNSFLEETESVSISTLRRLWALAQLAQACYFNGEWERLSQTLEKIKQLNTRSATEDAARFSYYTQLAIPLFDHRKETEALRATLQDAARQLRQFKHELRTDIRLGITVTCASAFLEYKMYNETVDVCEHFLTHYNAGVRLDAMLMLYTYETLAHLELGNAVYVNNVLLNIDRYFARNNFKGDFELVLLRTLRQLSAAGHSKITEQDAAKMLSELQSVSENAPPSVRNGLVPVIEKYIGLHSSTTAV